MITSNKRPRSKNSNAAKYYTVQNKNRHNQHCKNKQAYACSPKWRQAFYFNDWIKRGRKHAAVGTEGTADRRIYCQTQRSISGAIQLNKANVDTLYPPRNICKSLTHTPAPTAWEIKITIQITLRSSRRCFLRCMITYTIILRTILFNQAKSKRAFEFENVFIFYFIFSCLSVEISLERYCPRSYKFISKTGIVV